MKRLIGLLTVLIPLFSVAQVNNTYTLEGKTEKPATITLQYTIDGKPVTNTGEVANGKIKLAGTIDTRVQAYLLITPHAQSNAGTNRPMSKMVHLWLEPGHILVSHLDSSNITFSGTPLNDDVIVLNKQLEDINIRSREWSLKNGDFLKDTTAAFKDKYYKEGKRAKTERNTIIVHFIKSHPNSLVSLTELSYNLSSGVPDVSVVEPLFNGLSAEVKASPMGRDYQKKLINWKTIDIGTIAPDFMQPDTKGKPVRLSDFKGKYVLLDFWASWCHPCRDEHPNLIKQYNLYKNKNFTILSISMDGGGFGTKASWLKAIKDDHVETWTHICDLAGIKTNKVKLQYSVGSIPENFLIDPDGKIIGKSLRGDELNKKLKAILYHSNTKTTPGVSNSKNSNTGADKILLIDPAVRKGKLMNGFTYYIRKNTEPKNRVVFYLANKVGSILENEDQRGLAHFLEHMNFDGTTHFPKYELVNYLQKAGVRFGADLNAYTSFDETVYQLPLPGDNPEILKNGVQIMRDWAQEATLDPAEMIKERGVVLEEKRIGKGADERMRRQYLPILLNGSRYAERLPIGVDTVLNNFKPKTLKDFYRDWYRPDLQALIVVGDIDVDQMERRIREKFSDLKVPNNERARQTYRVPLTGKNQFIAVTDKEQTKSSIEVVIKHPEAKLKTAGDYRYYIIQHLFNNMISQRIAELASNKNNPPFVSAGTGIGGLLGGIDTYSTSFVANTGELERGFKAVWRETERVKRFGFTSSELDRVKATFLNRTESAAQQLNTTNSNAFVNDYLQNFLKDIASPGIAEELAMTKAYLPGISLDDMQKLTAEYIRETDRDIVLFGPEKDKLNLPNEKKVNQWMTEVNRENITPYKDNFISKTLLDNEPVPGKIISQKYLKSIDAIEWTMSNHAKVILKKTAFSTNFVLFNAFAPGGSSTYSNQDYLSANESAYILDRSGIGNFSYSDLSKFFAGKDAFSSTNVTDYYTKLQGGAEIKDLETLFQITYAKFTQPRYDKDAFNGTIASYKASIQNHGNDPATVFQDTVQAVLNNYNVRSANLTLDKLANIDLDKSFKIYNELLAGNASNFLFCFSGPIDTGKMRPLVEKYIASLPISTKNIEPNNLGIHPPAGEIIKQVNKGFEPKSKANLVFSGTYHFGAEDNANLNALKEIIQIKLINRLRKEEGGVYSPYVSIAYQKIPDERFKLSIGFECAPENLEKLIKSALDEVDKIKTKGPSDEDIEKFKAEDSRNEELQLKSDFWWLQYIQQQVLNHENLDDVNNYLNTLQKVTKQSIRESANRYLRDNNLIEFKLLPENFKP